MLQQHLPFTVLKRVLSVDERTVVEEVATAPTVYGIETCLMSVICSNELSSCNSTYRLRY